MENSIAETLVARAVDEMMAASPETATLLGAASPRSRWDGDISLARKARILAHYNDLIARGVNPDELSDANRAAIALFRHWAAVAERAPAFETREFPVTHVDGPQITLPLFLIQRHSLTTPASFDAYLERIRRMPDVTSRRISQAMEHARRGMIQPAAGTHAIARTCEKLTGEVHANPLYADFVTRLRLADIDETRRAGLQDDLVNALRTAMPAMCSRLHEYLSSLDGDRSGAATPPRYYEFRLFELTSVELSADAAHQRLLAEAAAARPGLDPAPAHPHRLEGGYDEASVQSLLSRAGNHVFDVEANLSAFTTVAPTYDLEIRRVESFRAHVAPAASYAPPTESNPLGIFYVNPDVLSAAELDAETERFTLPGQHLIPVTRLSQLVGLPAYSGGWSLYAMSQMHDGDIAGRRFVVLLATASAVVDSGLHGQSWSKARALDYLTKTTRIDQQRATRIVDRILVQPGEAAAAVIGYAEFLRLRQEAEARLGANFDEREFHDLLLKDGVTTLAELARRTGNWLQTRTR